MHRAPGSRARRAHAHVCLCRVRSPLAPGEWIFKRRRQAGCGACAARARSMPPRKQTQSVLEVRATSRKVSSCCSVLGQFPGIAWLRVSASPSCVFGWRSAESRECLRSCMYPRPRLLKVPKKRGRFSQPLFAGVVFAALPLQRLPSGGARWSCNRKSL